METLNRGAKEACTSLIRKKLYELVNFLRTYDSNKVEFQIDSDKGEVRMNNK